ncbi:SH3 domain-containing protein [Streptomyces sp. NBC_01433]|uniref:SH3 domain-containing protein n=1 Tax=Streptomyces sp. NBC_01433 TaxID=2903864 RepID=UPI00225BF738|nr:SH3 domain-containing protein [Streptomyces sp. NBC_01433]MCX4682127.1 SH3 domain-containing protein [Streptomyces sp. NBC_01433]
MKLRARTPARLITSAAIALSATAGLAVVTAPAAHAVGENSKCTVNWSHGEAGTVSKNGWNLRTGPTTGYVSRGVLYRGDTVKLLCSRGNWDYTELSKRSKSGMAKGTRGWVRSDGLYQLGG